MKSMPTSCGILFFLGAAVGTGGDLFHLFSGTLDYPAVHPRAFWGSPHWVPLIFGSATLLIGVSHPRFDSLLGARRPKPGERSWLACVGGIGWFLAMYAASGYLPLPTGGSRDIVLAGGAAAAWAVLDRSFAGLVQAAMTAAFGVLFEMLLIGLGAFAYHPANANFHTVPTWLPWLYVCASVTAGNFGRRLLR